MPQTIEIHDVIEVRLRNVISNGKKISVFVFKRVDISNPVIIECSMAEEVELTPHPSDAANI